LRAKEMAAAGQEPRPQSSRQHASRGR
jgi:hypothetical protein